MEIELIECDNAGAECGRLRLRSRADRLTPHVQAVLARVHGGISQLRCSCRPPETPARIRAIKYRDHYYARRHSFADHAEDCGLRELLAYDPTVPFSDAIFRVSARSREKRVRDGHAKATAPAHGGSGGFPMFALHAVAEAGRASFVQTHLEGRTDMAANFCRCLDAALNERSFSDGLSPRAAAAKRSASLSFGIIWNDPPRVRGRRIIVASEWRPDGPLLSVYTCSERDWSGEDDPSGTTAKPSSAPYFFLAAVDTRGEVRRLWRHTIWATSDRLAFVDSQLERHFLTSLHDDGLRFHKPLTREELSRMADVIHIMADGTFDWPHKPDALVFDPPRIRVVEFLGYAEQTGSLGKVFRQAEEYHRKHARRIDNYRRRLGPNYDLVEIEKNKITPCWKPCIPDCFKPPAQIPAHIVLEAERVLREQANALRGLARACDLLARRGALVPLDEWRAEFDELSMPVSDEPSET